GGGKNVGQAVGGRERDEDVVAQVVKLLAELGELVGAVGQAVQQGSGAGRLLAVGEQDRPAQRVLAGGLGCLHGGHGLHGVGGAGGRVGVGGQAGRVGRCHGQVTPRQQRPQRRQHRPAQRAPPPTPPPDTRLCLHGPPSLPPIAATRSV